MTDRHTLESALLRSGCSFEPVPRAQRWRYEQAWREVYARATYERTGKWCIPDFEWHVFSYGDAKSKASNHALELYKAEAPSEFIVWPEEADIPMYLCRGGPLPTLTEWNLDVYVFPTDLSWTMAFTHETSMDLGPYFSRREWLP